MQHLIQNDDGDYYGVSHKTTGELESLRRELRMCLTFARTGSPTVLPTLDHAEAVGNELARRAFTDARTRS